MLTVGFWINVQTEIPTDNWETYTNVDHRYSIQHPPDWEPVVLHSERVGESLCIFRTPIHERLTFIVQELSNHRGFDLEDVLESLTPSLSAAEGAFYHVSRASIMRLGENEVMLVPMGTPGEGYREVMWLIKLGDRVFHIITQVDGVEAIVREMLATMVAW